MFSCFLIKFLFPSDFASSTYGCAEGGFNITYHQEFCRMPCNACQQIVTKQSFYKARQKLELLVLIYPKKGTLLPFYKMGYFKVTGYTSRGGNSDIFRFASFSQGVQLFKKVFSTRRKFSERFPFIRSKYVIL